LAWLPPLASGGGSPTIGDTWKSSSPLDGFDQGK
jgi:hypothetical protein